MKGSGDNPDKEEPPLPPTDNCQRAMRRKYYIMRGQPFQAVSE
jgi:hypothetical protein